MGIHAQTSKKYQLGYIVIILSLLTLIIALVIAYLRLLKQCEGYKQDLLTSESLSLKPISKQSQITLNSSSSDSSSYNSYVKWVRGTNRMITREYESFNYCEIMNTYKFLKHWNFHPKTVADIGANDGIWTQITKEMFPNATIYMVDIFICNHLNIKC